MALRLAEPAPTLQVQVRDRDSVAVMQLSQGCHNADISYVTRQGITVTTASVASCLTLSFDHNDFQCSQDSRKLLSSNLLKWISSTYRSESCDFCIYGEDRTSFGSALSQTLSGFS